MISRLIITTISVIFFFINAYASVSTQEINFVSKSSGRTLVGEIYYPSSYKVEKKKIQHGIWMRENYSKNQSYANNQEKYPLIIFSHGFQGDRFGNSWIAEALVEKGYIVAMIEHTFNTSYDHSDLFIYTSMWQRPLDMSELLTYLLDHPKWGKVINRDKIAALGFSLGGTTALWLSGIKADKDKFRQTMDDKYARWSDWPKYISKQAKIVDWTKAEQSYKDNRIKAVISIAPDLGKAFRIVGLKAANVPTFIIVGDKDCVTPKNENSEFYAKGIKGAELWVIDGAEHFTFMNKCSAIGSQITPNLCSSDDNKEEIHIQVISKIYNFLQKNLR